MKTSVKTDEKAACFMYPGGKALKDTQKKRLTGAAVIVMSAITVSRITGFLRSTLITNMLKSKTETDAFIMAFSITDLMYNLLVGGAISAALIPVLTGYIARKDEEEGWKAVSTFINIIIIAMVAISSLGIIFSPQIVDVIAEGFTDEKKQLTVRLVRILFPSVSFIMLAGMTNGVLNSYQRFAAAAYGPSLYNLGSALSVLVLSRFGVEKVALGFMCSALFYFLFQLSFAIPNMKYYRPAINLKHAGFRRLFKLAVPSLMASSITQVNLLISNVFTSGFSDGSVTALRNANDTWQLPYGIFAMGMGVALLPALSEKSVLDQKEDFCNILNKGLRTVLLLNIPSAVGLTVLNIPVISAIYKWSDRADIATTGRILVFYFIALVTQSILAIINRAFYAINDTKTPLFNGIIIIITNAILCQFFNSITSLGVAGIALAYSLSSLINTCIMVAKLNRKIQAVHINELMKFMMKVLLASVVMGLVLWAVNGFIPIDFMRPFSVAGKLVELLYLLLEISLGVIVYFSIVLLMKVKEALDLVKTAWEKINQCFGKILKLL